MKDRGVLISGVCQHDNIIEIRPPLPFAAAHAKQLLTTLDDSLRSAA